MNTVLDDNMLLSLPNGERIKLHPSMHMLFEVEDLTQASPATVSRCGMVYMTPSDLGWKPYLLSWIDRYIKRGGTNSILKLENVEFMTEHMLSLVGDGLEKIKPYLDEQQMPCVPV